MAERRMRRGMVRVALDAGPTDQRVEKIVFIHGLHGSSSAGFPAIAAAPCGAHHEGTTTWRQTMPIPDESECADVRRVAAGHHRREPGAGQEAGGAALHQRRAAKRQPLGDAGRALRQGRRRREQGRDQDPGLPGLATRQRAGHGAAGGARAHRHRRLFHRLGGAGGARDGAAVGARLLQQPARAGLRARQPPGAAGHRTVRARRASSSSAGSRSARSTCSAPSPSPRQRT